jgi:hypothetical protein
MHVLIKDKFVYIPIPKNGAMTFTELLSSHGWKWVNFFENDLDFKDYILWGHLTEPNMRHTKGVEQYLRNNPDININDPQIAKMLVSAVFDQHGYSVHMTLGHLIFHSITWIPLDAKIVDWNSGGTRILNGNDLTNEFFKQNNIDIVVGDSDIRNKTSAMQKEIQNQIKNLKQLYEINYNSVVGNFLDSDILLYNRIVKQHEIKYGSAE